MDIDSMTPRERVMAALLRQPVDRVPYVEHLFDPRIATILAGHQLTPDPAMVARIPPDDGPGRWPAVRKAFLLLSAVDAEISTVVRRDNISYWPALPPMFVNETSSGGGSHREGMIKTRADLDRVRMPVLDDRFFAPAEAFLEHKGEFAACAMMYLGIDPTWNSMGFENFSICLKDDPWLVQEVLSRYAEWSRDAALRLCSMGFDFIWAADDIAFKSGPMFSPKVYREMLLPHTMRVAEAISLPWVYHSDGDLTLILDDLLSQGMNAIHPLEPGSMDPVALKHRYGDRIAFVGNISIDTLTLGTPDDVREEVRQRMAEMAPGGGYLVSSSNSVTEYCRPENVQAMIDAVEEFGSYEKMANL
jgi:uroporphyrinogen decarboxylase